MVKDKIQSLESIRGIACLMVVLSHISLTFFPFIHAFEGKAKTGEYQFQALIHETPLSVLFSGLSAVYIFFVLSGYILTKVALSKPKEEFLVSLTDMALRRYPRLMIPAAISCLIAVMLLNLVSVPKDSLSDWINALYGDTGHYSFYGALYSGAFESFFRPVYSTYNPVLWTLRIELLGSFLVYLICLNRQLIRLRCFLFTLFILTLWLGYSGTISLGTSLGLVSFYAGYLIYTKGSLSSSNRGPILLLLGCYLGGMHNTSNAYSFIYDVLGENAYEICNFLSGFLIVYSVTTSRRLSRFFSNDFGNLIGKLSFSVYLLHLPMIASVGVLFFNFGFEQSNNYLASALFASIGSIVLTFCLAYFFYKAIDQQAIKLSAGFSKATIRKFSNRVNINSNLRKSK